MRDTFNRGPSRDPRLRHSVHTTVVGAVLTTLLAPVLVMAILYPAVAAGTVAFALAAWLPLRALRRYHRARRRRGRTRRICVPKTGVCVEV